MLLAKPASTSALDVVNLTALMERTAGRREVVIGLIDGPVAAHHPELANATIHTVRSTRGGVTRANGAGLSHGTFVAGILAARRGSAAPAICPGCTLLARPIFLRTASTSAEMPSATPDELADAIVECVEGGARVLNLSVAVAQPSPNREPRLEQALDQAMRRGVLVVAATGNQGAVGSTAITRHPWVVPIAACDLRGRPMEFSNLSRSTARGGLRAPGEGITSLGIDGKPLTSGGTSAAVPFVTGAMALLWSAFPGASPAEVRRAVTQCDAPRRTTIVPPLLNAGAAYQLLARGGH